MGFNINLKGKKIKHSIPEYDFLERLSSNSNTTVYKAIKLQSNQKVAVKIFKAQPKILNQVNKNGPFEKEASIVAKLNHPHIVKLFDKGYTQEGLPFVTFELIEGLTLNTYLNQPSINVLKIKELMIQFLDALVYIHRSGIIHRDLKPQNLMIFKSGSIEHVKLLDFGISEFENIPGKAKDFSPQSIHGTPAYSAPEELKGMPSTKKSDIFSWGLLLLESLTGVPVFKGSTLEQIYQQQLNEQEISLPFEFKEHALGTFLSEILHKDPAQRLGDAAALLQKFERIDFSSFSITKSTSKVTEFTETLKNDISWRDSRREYKPLTVLTIQLLNNAKGSSLDEDAFNLVQHDQIYKITEISRKHGLGTISVMSDYVSIYFGYPQIQDGSTRRACNIALELLNTLCTHNNSEFFQSNFRFSLHSGNTLATPTHTPQGLVSKIAFELLPSVPDNSILITEDTQKLLNDPRFVCYKKIELSSLKKTVDTFLLCTSKELATNTINHSTEYFFGRRYELNTIINQWTRLNKNQGNLTVLKGDAGIGKSALIKELKRHYFNSGKHTIVETKCLPEYQHSSLHPILQLFIRKAGLDNCSSDDERLNLLQKTLTPFTEDLERELVIVCTWLGISTKNKFKTVTLQPLEQKAILFDLISNFLINHQRDDNCIFIIEDMHWSDPSTLNFINDLFSKDSNDLVVLMSTREWLSQLNERLIDCSICLNPLLADEAKHIVQSKLGQKNIENQSLQLLLNHSEGIPLYIEELTDMYLKNGELVLLNNEYVFVRPIQEVSVPSTLKELLHTQLDRLGTSKETAQMAATIGREIPLELLLEINDLSTDVEAEIQNLLDQGFLTYLDVDFKPVYQFRHALFRESAYESQTKTRRRTVHKSISYSLEKRLNSESAESYTSFKTDQLSFHLYKSNRIDEAITWTMKTTDLLVRQSASLETVNVCKRALYWLEDYPEYAKKSHREFDLRQILITNLVAVESFGSSSVGKQLSEIELLLQSLEIEEHMFPSMFVFCTYYSMRGEAQKAIKMAEYLEEKAQKTNNSTWLIIASAHLGAQYFANAEFLKAAKVLENGIALFDEAEHGELAYHFGMDQFILCSSFLCCTYAYNGRYEEIEAIEEKTLNYASKKNHAHSTASLYLGLACVYYYLKDRKKVQKYSRLLLDFNKSNKTTMFNNYAIILNAWANRAIEKAREAISSEEKAGLLSMRSFWYSVIAHEEIKQGFLEDATTTLFKCLSFIGTTDGPQCLAEINKMLGEIALKKKNLRQAAMYFEKGLQVAKKQGAVHIQNEILQLQADLF